MAGRFLTGGGAGLLLAAAALPLSASEGEWSGYAGLESRLFKEGPAYAGQERHSLAASLNLEYYRDFDGGDQRIVATGFGRWDANDSDRSHLDARELYWWGGFEQAEVTVGLRKVFWGVTETVHLVDVINQDDRLENLDGEDKLGQPMISVLMERDWGTLETFALLGFREAEFGGVDSRLRQPLAVDEDTATFDSGADNKRVDWALRYSQVIGDWDLGLSYFHGTDRDPRFNVGLNDDGETVLVPHYQLINQVGLDLQATLEDWLWKLEAVGGKVQGGDGYSAMVGGFEFTRYGLFGSVADLGWLMEYQFDDRDGALADNDVAIGARLTLNDTQSTEMLVAMSVDLDNQSKFLSMEASRRFGDHWLLEAEVRWFSDIDDRDPLYNLRQDDYLQLELKRYF